MANGKLAGKAATAERIGSTWIGWSGRVAHPDAPLGGGGPGFFADSGTGFGGNPDDSAMPSPEKPAPLDDSAKDKAPAEAPKPANPPPATQARTLSSITKSVQNEFVDVDITAEVLADTTGGPAGGAHTDFTIPAAKAPGYSTENGKITKFDGKLTWKGKITIQTRYGTDASATSLSCYGRGTTPEDVKNRDISLGFHESCHHVDFIAYLNANSLPDPPTVSKDMTPAEYDKAAADFVKAIKDYKIALDADSEKNTDEVGRKLSEVDTKGCYTHLLP